MKKTKSFLFLLFIIICSISCSQESKTIKVNDIYKGKLTMDYSQKTKTFKLNVLDTKEHKLEKFNSVSITLKEYREVRDEITDIIKNKKPCINIHKELNNGEDFVSIVYEAFGVYTVSFETIDKKGNKIIKNSCRVLKESFDKLFISEKELIKKGIIIQ